MNIKRIMLIRAGRRYNWSTYPLPLGLLYLISVLRNRYPGKYEIELVEQSFYDLSTEEIRKKFKKFDPDLVGFSICSMEAEDMEQIARVVKQEKPECITVLGGPHASVFYDLALKDSNINYVVIGEGEETFPELLEALENNKPLEKVKGIAFMRDGQMVMTEPRPYIEDLDSIPFPAWDLVNFERAKSYITMNGYRHSAPWAYLFTSRACPFKCAFCHRIFGKKVRLRSVENVLAEIELLVNQYGIKELHVVDDIFNIDLNRAKRICDEIVKRGIKVKIAFPNGLRADMMDRELIQKLKQAGAYTITYAIETASPRIQKLIHKNLNLEKVKQVIEWTDQEGIITQATAMLGFPTETLEELESTIQFVLNAPVLRCWFFAVVVYPRTDLWEIAKKYYPDFDLNFKDYNWYHLRYWSEKPFYSLVSGIDGAKIQQNAYRRFYLRPKIIFKILWRFPKNSFLFRGMWWALRVFYVPLYNLEKPFRDFASLLRKKLASSPN